MGVRVGNVEFHAGPEALGAPDELEAVIVDFIDGTQKRLDIAVQELENETIAKAIIRARQRKVRVRMVIEQSYLKAATARVDPWAVGGKHEANRQVHDAILRAKIDVKVDYNSKIFHQKFMVRDGASVLSGSTNFTPTGTHNNLNHVIIIHDKKVAKIFSREFAEIQRGHFGKRNEGHDKTPTDTVVSDVPIRVLFAPDHSPEMEIMKQMLKARERIDFAIFTFSKSSGIDDTMLRLLDLDMPIQGVFDGGQGSQDWAPVDDLKAKGADLFFVHKSGQLGKLHHKLMVLDRQVVIGGSFNYTGPANHLNDENIIILGDLETTSPTQREAQKKIASFALAEIERIIRDHARPVL